MLADVLLAALLGSALLVAAGLKIADRTSTAVAATTFGLRGRAARGVWLPLAALEVLLAAGVLAGSAPSAWAAAATLALFATALAVVFRARRGGTPDGALELAGEGPELGTRPDLIGPGLAFFTSEGCRLCRALLPHAERLGATVYDEVADRAAWAAAQIPGAPFAIALAPDGTVLAKGTVNTHRQLASVLAAARERSHEGDDGDAPNADTRRGFLATASAAVAAVTAGQMIGRLVAPGDADAFHFCGHIFTTDGCPHPTGLPRIDSRGLPLRGRDGRPVDDLGRLVDVNGLPVDELGVPLLDPDGRPFPPTSRTAVCVAAGRRFHVGVRTDGSWYRCCNGHVRKLIDCCSTSPRRINGDRSLRGYCFAKRRVFCVMYFQTKVPC